MGLENRLIGRVLEWAEFVAAESESGGVFLDGALARLRDAVRDLQTFRRRQDEENPVVTIRKMRDPNEVE